MYEAEIEELDRENDTAAVTFMGYGNAEVIPLQNLKVVEEGKRSDEDGKPKSRYEQETLGFLTHFLCMHTHFCLYFINILRKIFYVLPVITFHCANRFKRKHRLHCQFIDLIITDDKMQ